MITDLPTSMRHAWSGILRASKVSSISRVVAKQGFCTQVLTVVPVGCHSRLNTMDKFHLETQSWMNLFQLWSTIQSGTTEEVRAQIGLGSILRAVAYNS